jgi:hypothetical protein
LTHITKHHKLSPLTNANRFLIISLYIMANHKDSYRLGYELSITTLIFCHVNQFS